MPTIFDLGLDHCEHEYLENTQFSTFCLLCNAYRFPNSNWMGAEPKLGINIYRLKHWWPNCNEFYIQGKIWTLIRKRN